MISIDPVKMRIARRLNGTVVDGYAGYYDSVRYEGDYLFIIAIPQGQASVAALMREISKEE